MTPPSETAGPTTLKPTAEALHKSSEEMKGSAKEMAASSVQMKDAADRRTELAADRTVLAAERTYAAWVRTGLASLASGIGAKKLLAGVVPEWMGNATGTLLILFSAFCFVVAVWREIFPGAPPPEPDTGQIPPIVFIIANGFLTLVALSALVSIWFGRTGGS